jgi:hypothetical protein
MTFGQPGIPRQLADPQLIVQQDFSAALFLRLVMPHFSAPADEGFLVAPAGERENPRASGCEADVVDESVDRLEFGATHSGVAEIIVPLLAHWVDFEKH